MKLADLRPGDQVEVNIRGRQGRARITGNPAGPGRISIEPMSKGIAGFFSVKASQVRRVLRDSAQLMLLGGEL
jgi:hypothetical protein